jgi:hypothetical protein
MVPAQGKAVSAVGTPPGLPSSTPYSNRKVLKFRQTYKDSALLFMIINSYN